MFVHTKYLVNSFHTTVRMPPEILAVICSYLSTERDAISVSQVCRHWREVLTSFPPLWTHFTCSRVFRTLAGLERCKSLPIRIEFEADSSIGALESVILHGNEIISLTINHDYYWMPPLHKLFPSPMAYLEQLHIHSGGTPREAGEGQTAGSIWQDFPFLRELFVRQLYVPIGQFATPNLVHLILEKTWEGEKITTKSVLDMLCGSPLLETVLIANPRAPLRDIPIDHAPASLPNLRSIELGMHEVCSGLVPYLRFPPTAAVGFRSLKSSDVSGYEIPPKIMASSRYVLGGMDICTVILALAATSQYLVRFEGVEGSLEITFQHTYSWEVSTVFDSDGVLFSFSPRLNGVRELQFAGYYISCLDVGRLAVAMPNLASIYFFHCECDEEDSIFGIVSGSSDHQSPPFPHLKRLTVLEPGPGLIEVCRERKKWGVPFQTVVIGSKPCPYTPEQIAELGEFVGDVRVETPPGISEWSVGNRIFDMWSGLYFPRLVSSTPNLIIIILPG